MSVVVAMVARGDLDDAAARSGVPFGLASGFREMGVEVRGVAVDLPRQLERVVRRSPLNEPEQASLRSLAVRARMSRLKGVDGVVQLGSEYSLTTELPVVTFEDMTVQQHIDLGDAWLSSRSERSKAAWVERQRHAYEKAVGCCVASQWAAASVVEDYGIPRGKVRVVGRGNTQVPTPLDRDWSTPRFLFVGKDWRRKNLPAVLEAFGVLRREIPAARLDVVTACPDSGQEGVTFHGALRLDVPADRTRAERLFESATCFVMPSKHEAFGIVYVEASAGGIASIGTAVGAAREIIGDAGRVIDPDDPVALLDAMRELADPATAARLGALASERSALFTWRAVAERVSRALALPVESPLADFL